MLDDAPGRSPGVTWYGEPPPPLPAATLLQTLRGIARAVTLVVVTLLLTPFNLLFRWIEQRRALGVAPRIVGFWGRLNLWLCGLNLRQTGAQMKGGGAIVANHLGWIDIFTLLAATRVSFVAKAEVKHWPVVGPLSRQIDPVYIERRRAASKQQELVIAERLARGDRICIFAEATSTDGRRVLPFKTSLFGVFTSDALRPHLRVQPVSLVYRAPKGLPDSFYGWWGDMALGPHLWAVFTRSGGGEVEVIFHEPVAAADFPDRKALARHCEEMVRSGLEAGLRAGAP